MIETLFISAMFIAGYRRISSADHILYSFNQALLLFLIKTFGAVYGAKIHKPLGGCDVCMSSFIGSIAYFSYTGFDENILTYLLWPIFCVCLAFLGSFLNRTWMLVDKYHRKNGNSR